MNLINITSRQSKITPEEKCLNRMSKLPFMNTLLERVSHIKNTNSEFEGKYINISTDTAKLSRDVLSFQYKTELSSLKRGNHSINEKSKHTQKILDERVKGWYAGEKITTPASIIYREIDKICAEKNIKISTEEKERILDIVNEKHIKFDMLEKKASVISMINPLKLNRGLSGRINETEIKKNLIKDMKKEVPEQFKFLIDQFHKNDAEKQREELLTAEERVVFNDIPIVREIAGKIVSDVYNSLIENIYNTLFRDTETEQPLDFYAIKMEARTQAELIAKNKNTSKNNEISIEDTIRQKFESRIKVTSSSPDKDIEDLFGMLNRGKMSDQTSQFNPGAKVSHTTSVKNIPDQDTDDLISMLEKNQSMGDISDQRAVLRNK
ncbi:hypothetical protein ACISK3_00010 [Morganella morganii]|nr:hypothetical protein [Morganella morganii]